MYSNISYCYCKMSENKRINNKRIKDFLNVGYTGKQ